MQHADQQQPDPGLDIEAFVDVLDCGDAGRRTNLALQVASLLAGAPAPMCGRVMPVARRLALDGDVAVRRAFAAAVTELASLDADLVFAIASDDDEIALPFLARTPALDALRMRALLRAGGEARQAVIATRPDLSADAVDLIARELSVGVNALLLENVAARLAPIHHRTIYQRFGAVPDMLALLLARPDLPPVIRIVHAQRAAGQLQGLIAECEWLSADEAGELLADAEEGATLDALVAAEAFDLPLAVAFLIDSGMLKPSLVVRAAAQGAMHVVAECLAGLARLPRRRVEEQMYAEGELRALHSRCGLPQASYWALQAACEVAAEECATGVALSADAFGARVEDLLKARLAARPGPDLQQVA